MIDILIYRRDLFFGSAAAALFGPLSWGNLLDWLQPYLDTGDPWRSLAIFGAFISIYSTIRAAVDVASDLIEWRRGLNLFTAAIEQRPLATSRWARQLFCLREIEAIVIGFGVVFLFVAIHVSTNSIQDLGQIELLVSFTIPIGGLMLARRNTLGLYPFSFFKRSRLTAYSGRCLGVMPEAAGPV